MAEHDDSNCRTDHDREGLLDEYLRTREDYLERDTDRPLDENDFNYLTQSQFAAINEVFGGMAAFLAYAEKDYQRVFVEPTRVGPAPTMPTFNSGPSDLMRDLVPSAEGSTTVFDDDEEQEPTGIHKGMFKDFDGDDDSADITKQGQTLPFAVIHKDKLPPGKRGEEILEEAKARGGVVLGDDSVERPPSKTQQGLPVISPEDLEEIRPADPTIKMGPPMTYDDLKRTGRTEQNWPVMSPEAVGVRRDTDTEMLDPKHMVDLGTLSAETGLAKTRLAPVEEWDQRTRDYSKESPVKVEAFPDMTEDMQAPIADGLADEIDAALGPDDFIGPIHPGLDAEIDAEVIAMEAPDAVVPQDDSIFDDSDPDYASEAAAPLKAESKLGEVRIDYAHENGVDADGRKNSTTVEIDPTILGVTTMRNGLITRDQIRDDLRDRGVSTGHISSDDDITDPETEVPRGYSQRTDIPAVTPGTDNDSAESRNWFQYLFSGDWLKGSPEDQASEDAARLDAQRAESLERKSTFTPWSTQAKRRAGTGLGILLAGGIALGSGIAYLSSETDLVDLNTSRGAPTHIVENEAGSTIEHRLSKNISVILPDEQETPNNLSDDDLEDYEPSTTEAILDMTKLASSRQRSPTVAPRIKQVPVSADLPDVDTLTHHEPIPVVPGSLDVAAYAPSNPAVDTVAPARADAQPAASGVDTNCSFRAKMRFSSTAYSDRVRTLDALEQYVLAAFDAGNTEFTVYGMASMESQDDMRTAGHPVLDDDPINRYFSTIRGEMGKRDIERILRRHSLSATVNTENWNEVDLGTLENSRGYLVMVNPTVSHPNDNTETRTAFAGVPIAETCGTCRPHTASLVPDSTPSSVIADNDSDPAQLPIDDGDDERTRELIREFFGTPATEDEVQGIDNTRLGDDYDFDLDDSKAETEPTGPDYAQMERDIRVAYIATFLGRTNPEFQRVLSKENFSEEFENIYGYACPVDVARQVYLQDRENNNTDESLLASLLMPPAPDEITELGADDTIEILDDYDEEIVIDVDEADFVLRETLDLVAAYSPQRNSLENLARLMGDDIDGNPVEGDEVCYDAQAYMASQMALSNLSDMMERAEAAESEIDIDVDDFEDQTVYLSVNSDTGSALRETIAMSVEGPQPAHRLNDDGSLPELINDHYDPIAAEESESALARLAVLMGDDADGNEIITDAEEGLRTLARLEQMLGYDIDGNTVLPSVTSEYDAIAGAETDAALARLTGLLGYDEDGREQDMDSLYAMEMRTLAKLDAMMEEHYAQESSDVAEYEQSGVYRITEADIIRDDVIFEDALAEVRDGRIAILGDVTEEELDALFIDAIEEADTFDRPAIVNSIDNYAA